MAPRPKPQYTQKLDAAVTLVVAHLKTEPPTAQRQFAHLLTVCGLTRGKYVECDGRAIAEEVILQRALHRLQQRRKIETFSERAWHLTSAVVDHAWERP